MMAKHTHTADANCPPPRQYQDHQYFFHPFIDGQCYIVWEIICSKWEF